MPVLDVRLLAAAAATKSKAELVPSKVESDV
jgi:hypothetical protein